MPDGVNVAHRLFTVKQNSKRIRDASGKEQEQPGKRHFLNNRHGGDDDAPAAGNVAPHRKFAEALDAYRIKDYSEYTRRPDDAEQCPAYCAAYGNKGYRGVSSGYQKVYRGVVKYPHHLFAARCGYGVVKAGHCKQHYHGKTVHRAADDLPRVAAGAQYKQYSTGNGKQCGNSVSY